MRQAATKIIIRMMLLLWAVSAGLALALPAPPLALTAHVLPEYQQKCLEGGMDDYIAKPIQMRVLTAVLKQYWEKA